MILNLLLILGFSHGQVVPAESYEKMLHCWFKVRGEKHGVDEKHAFHVYSRVEGGPIWIAFKQALYSSYRVPVDDIKSTRKLPLEFEFRVGELPNNEWQAQVIAKLTHNTTIKKKKVMAGKLSIVRRDGKTVTTDLFCK